mgnify:CR=1 FL=1
MSPGSRSIPRALAATVSGIALLSAGSVNAQTAQTEATGVDDIVVTAQRRSENIRDVPFAVTAEIAV